MNKKKFVAGLVFLVLLCAIYVVADFSLKTQSGDLVLDPASDKVGIGTTSPNAKLDVKSNGDANVYGPALLVTAGADSDRLFYVDESGTSDGQLYLRNSENTNKVLLNSNGNSYLTGGNIGIGTTEPTAKLVVNGNVTPYSDNVSDLGSSGKRWKDVYYGGQLKTSSVGYLVPAGESAVEIVSNIRTGEEGQLDHSSIDGSLLVHERDYSQEYYRQLYAIEEELNILGEQAKNFTAHDIAVKRGYTAFLNNETQEYELISISGLIIAEQQAIKELGAENDLLKQELCRKDSSYGFCK